MKIQKSDDLLVYINKVKALGDQLSSLDVSVIDGDIVMTLLKSLPSSFKNLIVTLKTRPIKELTLILVVWRLLHKVSRRTEHIGVTKEDAVLVVHHAKGGIVAKHRVSHHYASIMAN